MQAQKSNSRESIDVFELLMFILVIATIILILLYTISGPSAKPPAGRETAARIKSSPERAGSCNHTPKKREKRQTSTQPKKDSQKCPYSFGNLAKRDKASPIPDECLSCSKMLECSGSSER
jgi:hypothetical protein